MNKRRVVITGLGTVNPLGNNVADSWAAARAGKCGIGPITQFDTTDFKCKLAGEVKGFDPETVVDKKEVRKMARFTLLALGAAAEAIADSGLDTEAEGKDIGVILSSGIGGLPTIEEQHARGEEKGMEKVSPYFVPMSIANMAAAQIAIALKAEKLVSMTDIAGLLRDKDDESTLIPEVEVSEIEGYKSAGIIAGGMIPKIGGMADAIYQGVHEAVIIDGRVPHSILLELFSDRGSGTRFYRRSHRE